MCFGACIGLVDEAYNDTELETGSAPYTVLVGGYLVQVPLFVGKRFALC
jgi:hypothetical protein